MSYNYWEARYQTHDMPWEKGAPSPGLVDFLAAHPDLPRGTVGVPGCGTGHDVLEFAKTRFTAFGFDLAPSAILLAEKNAHATGLKANSSSPTFCATSRRRNSTGCLNIRSSAPSNPVNVTIMCGPFCAG